MAKRLVSVVAVAVLTSLLMGCGGAPKYTMRQAVLDVPTYEHAYWAYQAGSTTCVLQYLFSHIPPAQIKTIIEASDLGGATPPPMAQAIQACGAIV